MKREEKYLQTFTNNMKAGVSYYQSLFNGVKDAFEDIKIAVLNELERSEAILTQIQIDKQNLVIKA